MEVLAETQQKPARASLPHAFTAANAAENARKAVQARIRRKAEQEQAIAQAKADLELVKPLLGKAIELATGHASVPDSEYRLQRLARTREQIETLDAQLLATDDPRAIKAITDSIRNLAEIERILAGRPLPGSHRPTKPKSGTVQSFEPSE